jgi:D-3-phosphoglycerate dehydrogenase
MFLQDLDLSRAEARSMLNEAGCGDYEAVWNDDHPDEEIKKQVTVVVTSKHQVGKSELDEFPAAQMVSLAFTGYNDVDRNYCKDRNLTIYFVPDYSSDSVAELATFMAGALLRRLPVAQAQIASGQWDRSSPTSLPLVPGLELRGRTVGIIGTGTIGLRTAEIFHYGYKCPLIAWSRNHKAEFKAIGGTYCESVEDVVRQADIVSLHLQLIDGVTSNYLDRDRIALLREASILINCSRTGLIDLAALVTALQEKKIFGAGLDITEEEHLRDDLSGLDNLILTPHIGYRTDKALARLAQKTIENIGRFRRQDPKNRLPAKP